MARRQSGDRVEAWPEKWTPVTAHYLTEDVRIKARRMEVEEYGKRQAEQRVAGVRRSARLA